LFGVFEKQKASKSSGYFYSKRGTQ